MRACRYENHQRRFIVSVVGEVAQWAGRQPVVGAYDMAQHHSDTRVYSKLNDGELVSAYRAIDGMKFAQLLS